MRIPSALILLISIAQAKRERRAVFDLITDNHKILITHGDLIRQRDLITHEDLITNTNLVLRKLLQNETNITLEYLRNLSSKKLREKNAWRRNKDSREETKKQFLEKECGTKKQRIQKQNREHLFTNFRFLTKLAWKIIHECKLRI